MTYNITLTNGQTLVNIADGLSDTSYSSLTLFGKNYAGYGPTLNINQVHMLENFSFTSPPPNPLQGQLWWDSTNKRMNVRKDQEWKVVSGPTPAASAPVTDVIGDLWWDTTNNQLNTYNGSTWVLVGPAYKTGQGISGMFVKDVVGVSDQATHTVTTFMLGNTITGVISKDATFTTNDLLGFSVIRPGFNLPSSGSTYYGNSENALNLGGVLAANFLRSDVNSTTNFALSVKNNAGLTVGANDDLVINVQGSEVALSNAIVSRDTVFYTKPSGVSTMALRLSGSTGRVHIAQDPVDPTNVANKNYVDTAITATAATLLKANGTTALSGTLAPSANDIYSLGTSLNSFNSVYASAFVGGPASSVSASNGTFNTVTLNNAPATGSAATTKTYVDSAITALSNQTTIAIDASSLALVNGAPANLSTLAALATAVNNNSTFGNDIVASIATLAPKASPSFTGTPQSTTPLVTDISTRVATTAFVDAKVTASMSTILGGSAVFSGPITANGGIITTTDGTLDIGSPTNKFNNIYGTAISAAYADLAEKYVSDADYEPGTVLDFGGEFEVTICLVSTSRKVAGVVSTAPAVLMNEQCAGVNTVALALQGRCPVKVIGPIRKGDMLVSAANGRAQAGTYVTPGTCIGKALENFEGGEGVIEVAISRC